MGSVDASYHFVGHARAKESADGSALILTVDGDGLREAQTKLLAHAEQALPSTVFGTGAFRDQDAVLVSVGPHETGPYEGANSIDGRLDAATFSGKRLPAVAGPLVVSRAEEWGRLGAAEKSALRRQFNDVDMSPVPVHVKQDAVVWRRAPAAAAVCGRKGVLYTYFVFHELTLQAIRERRVAALGESALDEARDRPADEAEDFQRAFGAVVPVRAGTKIDYVGQNYQEAIVLASDPTAKERLLVDAQARLDKVKQNLEETVLWRVQVVEGCPGCGNHLQEQDMLKGRYKVLHKLGEGATATVFLCEDCHFERPASAAGAQHAALDAAADDITRAASSVRGELRALKKIPCIATREGEVRAMRMLDHPNIIKLFDSFYVGVTSFCMVLELSRGGALLDEVEQLQVCVSVERDLFVWQLRPMNISVRERTHTHFGINAGAKAVQRSVREYHKRDLCVWQKRPINISLPAGEKTLQ